MTTKPTERWPTMAEIQAEDKRLITKLIADLKVNEEHTDEAIVLQFVRDIVENRYRKFQAPI